MGEQRRMKEDLSWIMTRYELKGFILKRSFQNEMSLHDWLTILCKLCWTQKRVYVNRFFWTATKCSNRAGCGRDVNIGVPRTAWQLEVVTRFQPHSILALVDIQLMCSIPQCCSTCFHQSSKWEAKQFLVVCFITSWNKSFFSHVNIHHVAFISPCFTNTYMFQEHANN